MMKISFLFILISGIAFAQLQDTVTVIVTKKTANNDTKIFQDALNRKEGKALKILVKKGLYNVDSNLSTSRAHTSIVFEKGAVIYFSSNTNSGFAVLHDNFSLYQAYIKGNGISAKDFYTGYGVLLNGVTGCVIKKSTFENISGNNILFYPKSTVIGCSNNKIIENTFIKPVFDLGNNGDESAIMLGYSGEGYKHNNNIIKDNVIDCNYTLKIGLGMISHGKNNLFENNKISNCRNYGIILYESKDKDSTLSDNILRLNTIHNIGEVSPKKTVKGMGIYLMKSSKSKVIENKIYNTLINSDKSETLGAGAISVSVSPNTLVDGNLIDGSYMYGIVSDYSFGSDFTNNTVKNVRRSGAYFINMSDVTISNNRFENIGEVVLKGYFENTSLEYIKNQMKTDTYKNRDTGNGFKINNNRFYTDKDILYFVGTDPDSQSRYSGNKVKNNIVENNFIYGNPKTQENLIFFRKEAQGTNIIKNNQSR
ncbi:right-handed parallel beta-helix repeat-containing protein [Chryseobacterium soldanellicola]|nr:right-handed parallel beta-helix repeat-containing protein [Chryseobacterium soldanellicola]